LLFLTYFTLATCIDEAALSPQQFFISSPSLNLGVLALLCQLFFFRNLAEERRRNGAGQRRSGKIPSKTGKPEKKDKRIKKELALNP
jgi:hypothetical protein